MVLPNEAAPVAAAAGWNKNTLIVLINEIINIIEKKIIMILPIKLEHQVSVVISFLSYLLYLKLTIEFGG